MIYISSACVKKNHIAEIIEQYAENGIKNIELSGGTDYYPEIVKDLKRLKQKYGVHYACHAYFPPPKNPFVVNLAACNDDIYQKSIDYYVRCVDVLKYLGCGTLSIHAGFLIEIGTDEIGKKLSDRIIYDEGKAYDRFCSAYQHIAGLCRKNNISFYLENNVLSQENYIEFGGHNYLMMTDYKSIMKMKGQLDFDLLLDLGHLHVSSHTLSLDFSQECKKLCQYVKWYHISENNGISDEHRPLMENSDILKEFYRMYSPALDVTIETVGDVDEILRSVELISAK